MNRHVFPGRNYRFQRNVSISEKLLMRLIAIKANISLQVFEVRFADVDETRKLHAWTDLLEKVFNFDCDLQASLRGLFISKLCSPKSKCTALLSLCNFQKSGLVHPRQLSYLRSQRDGRDEVNGFAMEKSFRLKKRLIIA